MKTTALTDIIRSAAGRWQRSRAASRRRAAEMERQRIERIRQRPLQTQQAVHMDRRPAGSIICPLCRTEQRSDRALCWQCGARFLFGDET
ncbi:MAG: hypothetical protein K2P26_04970 [Oscillospiraceae bacterium]|nr:hypothetical protein [Oscillospiraceae bacterium]